jgi:tetratricopeptide (TPR) repeat protein
MNKIEKVETEYKKAIKINPTNSSLYNDYAVFLSKYRKDVDSAYKDISVALRLNPKNRILKSNINKILQQQELKSRRRHNIFLLFIVVVMLWIGYEGYTNFLNLLTLFVLAQTVLNYPKTLYNNN